MSDQHHSVRFPTTCWSQLAVGSAGAERTAFELLAQRYWRPIEAYLRQALRRRAESHDLTQEFFLWMIETGFLAKADPSRGRFRAFIKVALRNYVADHDRERRTRKRGGARAAVSLEHDGSALDLPDPRARPPDQELDEQWRAQLVENALRAVEAELRAQQREVVFQVFRDYFLDPAQDLDYHALAERHQISRAAVSNHLMHAKRLYRAKLTALIRETVVGRRDLEQELLWLFGRELP